LEGFEKSKHLYFSDSSVAIAAALRGQGVALGSPGLITSELESGELTQLGQTRVPFGQYILLESNERSTAPIRAAFVGWLDAEVKRR